MFLVHFKQSLLKKQISQSNSLWKYNLISWGLFESMKKEEMGAYFSLVLKRFLSFLHNTSFLSHKKEISISDSALWSKQVYLNLMSYFDCLNKHQTSSCTNSIWNQEIFLNSCMNEKSFNTTILLREILGVGDVEHK